MRKLNIFVISMILAFVLIISSAVHIAFAPPFPIGNAGYIQPYPYESNPNAHASVGVTLNNPGTNAYDGDLATNVNFVYGDTGWFNVTTFDNSPSPTFTIGRVDLKITHKAIGGSTVDDRYRLGYTVSPSSAFNVLQNWRTGYSMHRPAGAGLTGWTKDGTTPAPTNWQSVDETTQNADVDYVKALSTNLNDTYTLSAALPTTTWAIGSVKVSIYAKRTASQTAAEAEQIQILVRTGGSNFLSPNMLPTTTGSGTAYTKYANAWTTNPQTHNDWTWAEISALQAGIRSVQVGTAFTEVRVTQVYVEVFPNTDEDAMFPEGAGAATAPGNKPFSKLTEPNDGVWSWTDIGNLKVCVQTERQGIASDFKAMYIYEVWLSVYKSPFNPPAGVSIQPSNITKELWLNATKYFYVDVYATNVANMWGYQFSLGYDTNILTATEYFSYSPFDSKPGAVEGDPTPGNRIEDITYYPVSTFDNVSLYVNGFDNTKGGWGRYGVSPYLDTVDGVGIVNQSAAETLRPIGNGFYTAWTGTYADWDEVIPDEDSTYVNASSAGLIETSTLTTVTPPVGGAITNVRVLARARNTLAARTEQIQILLYNATTATLALGALHTPPAAPYTTFWSDWATNPFTGGTWSWAQVNALQAGVKSVGPFTGPITPSLRVTQLYVEVSYTDNGIGDFTFQDLVTGDVSNAVYVDLFAYQPGGNDTVQIFVHDGTSYQSAGTVKPSNSSFTWMSKDVSSILNTNTKINNAKVYLVKQTDASKTPDNIRIDAMRLTSRKTGWTRFGKSSYLNAPEYPAALTAPGVLDTFNDTDTDTIWDVGEPAIRDVNGDFYYETAIDVVLAGPIPKEGDLLSPPGVNNKYYDTNGNGIWGVGEPAIRDVNTNGFLDPVGDVVLVGTAPGILYQSAAGSVIGDFDFSDTIFQNLGKKLYIEMYGKGDGDDQVEVWLFHDNKYTLEATLTPAASYGWVSSPDVGSILNTKAKINDARVFLVKKTTAAEGAVYVDAMRLKVYTGVVSMTWFNAYGAPGGLTGNGTIARIYFQVSAYGSTELKFGAAYFTDPAGSELTYTTYDFFFSNKIKGDSNGDGAVNSLDIGALNGHWAPSGGAPPWSLGYDRNFDCNDDGYINSLDMGVVNANWGRHT